AAQRLGIEPLTDCSPRSAVQLVRLLVCGEGLFEPVHIIERLGDGKARGGMLFDRQVGLCRQRGKAGDLLFISGELPAVGEVTVSVGEIRIYRQRAAKGIPRLLEAAE